MRDMYRRYAAIKQGLMQFVPPVQPATANAISTPSSP